MVGTAASTSRTTVRSGWTTWIGAGASYSLRAAGAGMVGRGVAAPGCGRERPAEHGGCVADQGRRRGALVVGLAVAGGRGRGNRQRDAERGDDDGEDASGAVMGRHVRAPLWWVVDGRRGRRRGRRSGEAVGPDRFELRRQEAMAHVCGFSG